MCRSKHVEPSINFGIINSITKLHLVGVSTESGNDTFSLTLGTNKKSRILDFFVSSVI